MTSPRTTQMRAAAASRKRGAQDAELETPSSPDFSITPPVDSPRHQPQETMAPPTNPATPPRPVSSQHRSCPPAPHRRSATSRQQIRTPTTPTRTLSTSQQMSAGEMEKQRIKNIAMEFQRLLNANTKKNSMMGRTGFSHGMSPRDNTADEQDARDSISRKYERRMRRLAFASAALPTSESFVLPPELQQWVRRREAALARVKRPRSDDTNVPASSAAVAGRPVTFSSTATSRKDTATHIQATTSRLAFDIVNGDDLLSLPADARVRIGTETNVLAEKSLALIIAHSNHFRPARYANTPETFVALNVRLATRGEETIKIVTCIRLNWVTFDWKRLYIERPFSWQP